MEVNTTTNYVMKEVFTVELVEARCENRRWVELAHTHFYPRALLLHY
jgi:hypothetical protein